MTTPTSNDKWTISFTSALIFILIASPFMFRFTQEYIGVPLRVPLINQIGVPTIPGLAVHGIVYMLIVRTMMI